MWNPTHVQLTVLRARHLLSKGKSGNNDVYVTIHLGKQKFQTSTIKNAHKPEWFEECELEIPSISDCVELCLFHRGMLQDDFLGEIPSISDCVELCLYHRGMLQDDFLGQVVVNLSEYKVHERPRSEWLTLKSKPKKPDNKPRGEIEVRLSFVVKSELAADGKGKKRQATSFKGGKGANRLTFIRSVSFRDGITNPSKTIATDSVLHPSDKSWRYSMPVIPTDVTESDAATTPDNIVPSVLHSSHGDLTSVSEESTSLKRSQSTPIHKPSPRQRIHMGSATLPKPESYTSVSPLRLISEEPSSLVPPSTITPSPSITSPPLATFEESLSLPSTPKISESPDINRGSPVTHQNTAHPPIPPFPSNIKGDASNRNSSSSNERKSWEEKQQFPDGKTNPVVLSERTNNLDSPVTLISDVTANTGENQNTARAKIAKNRRSKIKSSFENPDVYKVSHARIGYQEQLMSHLTPTEFEDVDVNTTPQNLFVSRKKSRENCDSPGYNSQESRGSTAGDGQGQVGYNVHGNIPDNPPDLVDHRRGRKDDVAPRQRRSAVQQQPLQPFPLSDSDEYAESSSTQSRRKVTRDDEVLRRRTSKHRSLLLSPQHRRYSIHGMIGHYDRPALYLYDDIHTCHEEFRRSYLSDDDSQDLVSVYRNMTKEELIHLCLKSKAQLIRKDQYLHDLELYIDDLLVRVMETTPHMLGKARMSRC